VVGQAFLPAEPEKLLNEQKDRLSEADMAAVRAATAKVNQARVGDDASAIRRALEDLDRASQAMSQHLSAASSAAAGSRATANGPSAAPDGGPRGAPADEVIDVEFEEKKQKRTPSRVRGPTIHGTPALELYPRAAILGTISWSGLNVEHSVRSCAHGEQLDSTAGTRALCTPGTARQSGYRALGGVVGHL
jgi:hypothetical protein